MAYISLLVLSFLLLAHISRICVHNSMVLPDWNRVRLKRGARQARKNVLRSWWAQPESRLRFNALISKKRQWNHHSDRRIPYIQDKWYPRAMQKGCKVMWHDEGEGWGKEHPHMPQAWSSGWRQRWYGLFIPENGSQQGKVAGSKVEAQS